MADADLMRILGLDTPDLVDARPAREHARRLRAAGWGTRTIAARAGVHRRVVQALLNGRTANQPPTKRVRPETERRILALREDAR